MPKKYIPLFPLIPEQVRVPLIKERTPELVLELPIPEYYDIPKLEEKKNSDEKKSEVVIDMYDDDIDCFIIE